MESLELPKVRQATCLVWWGMGDFSRSNTVESRIISIWFGIHRTISHSFGDISVIWDLWVCSWELSGVPSRKSRLLTCLIGNLELLCMQFRGIQPHLSPTGKSQGFPRVAVGTRLHSRFTAGMAFQYSCLFSNFRTPVYLRWISQETKLGLQDNTNASRN